MMLYNVLHSWKQATQQDHIYKISLRRDLQTSSSKRPRKIRISPITTWISHKPLQMWPHCDLGWSAERPEMMDFWRNPDKHEIPTSRIVDPEIYLTTSRLQPVKQWDRCQECSEDTLHKGDDSDSFELMCTAAFPHDHLNPFEHLQPRQIISLQGSAPLNITTFTGWQVLQLKTGSNDTQ